jgi:hypothetical protein
MLRGTPFLALKYMDAIKKRSSQKDRSAIFEVGWGVRDTGLKRCKCLINQ